MSGTAATSHTHWWGDQEVVDTVRAYAHLNGLLMQSSPSDTTSPVNVAFSLRPTTFPKDQFDLVTSIEPDLHLLLDRVSLDHAFMEESLKQLVYADDFARRLYQLYMGVQKSETAKSKPVILMNRSDYMLTLPSNQDWKCVDLEGEEPVVMAVKQVEMNTMSASMAGFCAGRIQKLHRFVQSRYGNDTKHYNMPDSSRFAEALAVAWRAYGNSSVYVLFVVHKEDSNSYDQRMLEFSLWERNQIKVIRRTFQQLKTEARHGADQELIVGDKEVGVVYFRTAYAPEQYESDEDWSTRLLLETSRAPTCPSIALQLVGSKRVQQMLTLPGVLERFITDEDVVSRIRSVFAGIYSLSMGPEGDAAIEKALKDPQDFVLKPEREGGDNNFFGADLVEKLESVKSSTDREGYILMEMLRPPRHAAFFLSSKSRRIEREEVTCELGVYGIYVRQGDQVLLNQACGALSRLKVASSNEGGMMTGRGKLDMVDVVDHQDFLKSLRE